MTFPLRCGRLDQHEAHDWKVPARIHLGVITPTRTYTCNGHVIAGYAEQTWADEADAAELRAAMADERWAG